MIQEFEETKAILIRQFKYCCAYFQDLRRERVRTQLAIDVFEIPCHDGKITISKSGPEIILVTIYLFTLKLIINN